MTRQEDRAGSGMLRDKAAVDSFTGRTRPTPLPPRQRLLLLDAGARRRHGEACGGVDLVAHPHRDRPLVLTVDG